MNEFDPLLGYDNFDYKILSAVKKREIKNILKSYVVHSDRQINRS